MFYSFLKHQLMKKMKKINYLAVSVALLFLSAFALISNSNWKIKETYTIKFSGKEADGIFKTFSGDIQFDENNLATSKFNVKLDVNSINMGNGLKNKHAKSDRWFDAKKYPEITFKSEKIIKSTTGYEVTGILQMHSVQKTISIPFTFLNQTFTGSFKVNRLDYQIGVNENNEKIGTEIKIDLIVPVTN